MTRTKIFSDATRGTSMTEVILAMAIVAIVSPFLYTQITDATDNVRDMAFARNIIALRGNVLNYVRANQDRWPDVAQIKLADDELSEISGVATAGFIDKYAVSGATITDVYLAFDTGLKPIRTMRVARHIGMDAAVVSDDGVAYGASWAVSAPDFQPGQLIYRVTRDIAGIDTSKYLHRTSSDDEDLNVMQRDLNMGGNSIFNIATMVAKSARIKNAAAMFANVQDLSATTVFFPDGANMNATSADIGAMRVTGDVTGFRNITANNLNGASYTTHGRIVTDRASVTKSVNVAKDFILKSNSALTVSGFAGVSANTVKTPYVSATEMTFFENFGLTISGELLMSTNAPLKIGAWTFPSTVPPSFNALTFERATIPGAPSRNAFGPLMQSGWKSVPPKDVQ